MRFLKHLLFTAAVHITLLAVAGEHRPFASLVEDATPLREATTGTARTRLHRSDGRLLLEFQLPRPGDATITLTDARGHVLLREHVQGRGLQVRHLPTHTDPGAITMRIEQEGITLLRKLVIEQA